MLYSILLISRFLPINNYFNNLYTFTVSFFTINLEYFKEFVKTKSTKILLFTVDYSKHGIS